MTLIDDIIKRRGSLQLERASDKRRPPSNKRRKMMRQAFRGEMRHFLAFDEGREGSSLIDS